MTKTNGFLHKKLLAAAILAGLSNHVLAINNTETAVYGFLNGEVESVQATGGATPYDSRGRVTDGNSRIGFTGSIEINPNFKGILQIEGALNNFEQGGVNDQGKSSTLESRNTFVGIQSQRYGRLIVGNNDSVYRSLVGSGGDLGGNLGMSSHGLDLWNNTSAQLSGNQNSLFGRGEARYKNSIHYLSPVMTGVQLGASYGFDEAQSNNTNHSRYALAARYSNGPFAIGVGYDRQANTGVDTTTLAQGFGFQTDAQTNANTSFTEIIASYKFATKTYVGVGFESGKFGYVLPTVPTSSNFYTGLQNGSMTQHSAMISVAQDVTAEVSVLASYGKLGNLSSTTFGAAGDFGASQFSLGATYKLNENFMPYVYYTNIKNKPQQNVNLGSSLYSNNAGTSNAFLAPGDSPRAFGVGLIARF